MSESTNNICFGRMCNTDRPEEDTFEWHETATVITPYYRPFVEYEDSCTPMQEPNYTEYDLFCLRTRMELYIRREIDPSLSCVFAGYEYKGAVRLYLNVMDAGQFKPIDNEIANKLQKKVDEYTSDVDMKDYCLLMSVYDIKDFPVAWVKTVMPFISLDSVYHHFYDDAEGSLFIRYNNLMDYPREFNKDHDILYGWLKNMYKRGVVLLDRVLQKEFISNWKLRQVDSEQDDELTLYEPTWKDSRFASDPYLFLIDRLGHMPIDISMGNDLINLCTRHAIAKVIGDKFEFRFHRDKVHLNGNIGGIDELMRYVSIIESGLPLLPNKVAVVTVASSPQLNRYIKRIREKYPGSDIALYECERFPPRVLSFTISVNDTMDSALMNIGQ